MEAAMTEIISNPAVCTLMMPIISALVSRHWEVISREY